MKTKRVCALCERPIRGRSDKKFFTSYCRATYHNQKRRKEFNYVLEVNKILRKNRKLLFRCSKDAQAGLKLCTLLEKGFQPEFFTGVHRNDRGIIYICYELAYWFGSDGDIISVIEVNNLNLPNDSSVG